MKGKWIIFLAGSVLFSGVLACNTAKNTGSTVKDATVTGAKEVGDKAEDVGSTVADKSEDVASATADVAKEAAEETEDGSITAAIKTSFARDDLVDASNIDVDTQDGHVTLNGTVKNEAEKERALALAQKAAGVKSVKSNLTIKGG